MKKTILFLPIILGLIFTSCNSNSTNINDVADKEDAEKVIEEFYSYIDQNTFTKAEKLFSDEFYAVTSKVTLRDIFQKTNKNLGNYEKKVLVEWKTRRMTGTNSKTEYFFIYEVKYQKFKAKETVVLSKEKDGVIRIISYNVNSEGFLDTQLKK